MRRAYTVAVLLILTIGASTSACVAGSASNQSKFGARIKSCQSSVPKLNNIEAPRCNKEADALPSNCGIRGLAQFHFFIFPELTIGAPQRVLHGRISVPSNMAPRISSIGSPETDRGPPIS